MQAEEICSAFLLENKTRKHIGKYIYELIRVIQEIIGSDLNLENNTF